MREYILVYVLQTNVVTFTIGPQNANVSNLHRLEIWQIWEYKIDLI